MTRLTQTRWSLVLGLAIVAAPLLAATPAEAGKKKAAQKQRQTTRQVQQRNAHKHNRVKVNKKVAQKQRQSIRQTQRHNPRTGNRVKIEKQVTRRQGKPNITVREKTVARRQRVAGTNQRRLVTLTKTTKRVGDGTQKVTFDREVTKIDPVRRRVVNLDKNTVRRNDKPDIVKFNRQVVRKPAPRPVTQHIGRHRPIGYNHYPHGHAQHRCSSSCSHFSIRIGVGGDDFHGRISYSNSHGHRHGSACHRCGGGVYKHVWIAPVYVTCYDYCGRPYRKLQHAGYYKRVWNPCGCGH